IVIYLPADALVTGVGGATACCSYAAFSLALWLAGSLALSDRIFSAATGFSKLMASMRLLLLAFMGLACHLVRAASSSCLSASPGWQMRYEQDLGVCHYFRAAGSRQQVNFSTAESWCRDATSVSNLASIRLVRLSTDQQRTLVVRALTQVGIGYSNLWTEAQLDKPLLLGHRSEVTELKSVACNSSLAVKFTGHVIPAADGSYKVNSVFSAVTLDNLGTTVCEYDVPRCDMSTASNFNWTRMQPDVDPIADGRIVKAACAPGFFRTSEVDGTPDSLIRNRYRCDHVSSASSIGTANLVAMNNTVVDHCKPMSCQGSVLLNLNLQVDFKETYRNRIDPNREYLFGESIPVECKTGYVKITNRTDINSTIDCRQNALKPNEGQWDPIFCTPVGCNKSAMSGAYDYNTMQMYKAYDRLKDRTYTSSETHMFPYYPNTVYVRCSTPGQFFRDRKYDKTFQCNLVPNSTIEATWSPVEGTLESSMQCQPITCLTNELVAMSYRATIQDYLTKGNFNSSVTLTDDTGLETKMSAAIDATSGKKFVPEPKEAGSAQSLGATVIVILVVFFTLIVVLDIATLSRDIKLLKQNIRRLKLKASMKKND
uniref:Sushi domain-containing protein n=1 Tax=Macrostomum lignano TaxID=282301 RepID=A0A1I8G0H6_9PLAT